MNLGFVWCCFIFLLDPHLPKPTGLGEASKSRCFSIPKVAGCAELVWLGCLISEVKRQLLSVARSEKPTRPNLWEPRVP